MNTNGWYITKMVAPKGTEDAGKPMYAACLDGVYQEGFPATLRGYSQAVWWGIANGHGYMPYRSQQ